MKILATFETPKAPATCAGRVILVDLEEGAHPLVTWWENAEVGGRNFGHYFTREERKKAETDFAKRCEKGC